MNARTAFALGFFGLSILSTTLGGCAAKTDDSSDDTAGSDESDLIRAATLAGTYENPTTENNDLPFYSITFGADHTYTATGGCRQDGPGAHCFAISRFTGTWAGHKSGPQLGAPGGAQQIVMTDSFNQKNSYFYSLVSGKLSLTETYRGTASVFEKHVDLPAGPTGSFKSTGADSLPFFSIQINTDGTFSATGGCKPPAAGAVECFALTYINGSWTTALSGPQLGSPAGAPQLVLVDSLSQQSKYFFMFDGKTLSLSETYGGEASDFTGN